MLPGQPHTFVNKTSQLRTEREILPRKYCIEVTQTKPTKAIVTTETRKVFSEGDGQKRKAIPSSSKSSDKGVKYDRRKETIPSKQPVSTRNGHVNK